MTIAIEKWKSELEKLNAQERAELAHFLIHSLDQSAEDDAKAALDDELTRRAAEIQGGNVVGKPASQVFTELRERYS